MIAKELRVIQQEAGRSEQGSLTPTSRNLVLQTFHAIIGMRIFQALTFISGLFIARGLAPQDQGRFQLLLLVTICTVTIVKPGLDEG